jgi:hypothetical protein
LAACLIEKAARVDELEAELALLRQKQVRSMELISSNTPHECAALIISTFGRDKALRIADNIARKLDRIVHKVKPPKEG